MSEMEAYCPDNAKYLSELGKEQWTRSHFSSHSKCDLLCNNICESWNKYVMEARDKPIITMLEMIRRLVMCRLQSKREFIAKCDHLICPRIIEKLKAREKLGRDCDIVHGGGGGGWEIRGKGEGNAMVC